MQDLTFAEQQKKCSEYINEQIKKFYNEEYKSKLQYSLDAPIKYKNEESKVTIESWLKSNDPSPYEEYEKTQANLALVALFKSLPKQDYLIFKDAIGTKTQKALTTTQIAEKYILPEQKVQSTIKDILYQIKLNVGDNVYININKRLKNNKLKEQTQNLKLYLKYLKPRERKILKARYVYKMSYKDISKTYDTTTPSNIKDIIKKTQKKLKILTGNNEIEKQHLTVALDRGGHYKTFDIKSTDTIKNFLVSENRNNFLSKLSVKNREIFQNYYIEGLTLRQIAEKYNLSWQAVSQLLKRIEKQIEIYENGSEIEKQHLITALKRGGKYNKADDKIPDFIKTFLVSDKKDEMLSKLSVKNREIFQNYYIEGQTLKQIAKKYNISQTPVSIRLKRTTSKIENYMKSLENGK